MGFSCEVTPIPHANRTRIVSRERIMGTPQIGHRSDHDLNRALFEQGPNQTWVMGTSQIGCGPKTRTFGGSPPGYRTRFGRKPWNSILVPGEMQLCLGEKPRASRTVSSHRAPGRHCGTVRGHRENRHGASTYKGTQEARNSCRFRDKETQKASLSNG